MTGTSRQTSLLHDPVVFLITRHICGSRYFYEYAVLPQHWLKNDDDDGADAAASRDGDQLFSVYHYVRATLDASYDREYPWPC